MSAQEKTYAAGRAYVINMITELEKSKPGWNPMFYFTGSYERDISEAARLRREFDIPKDTPND